VSIRKLGVVEVKNPGKKFEEDFKNSIPADMYYWRIADSAMSWGEGENIRFTPKNPFDAILYSYPMLILLELKSTQGTSLPFDKIKPHQIKRLTEANAKSGVSAGFVINFRKYERTFFIGIEGFNRFVAATTKKSINLNDLIEHGAIEIYGNRKKTRYRYDIQGFAEKAKGAV
jgi:recombination protein U